VRIETSVIRQEVIAVTASEFKGNKPTFIEHRPSGIFIVDSETLAKVFGEDFSSPAYDALSRSANGLYDDFLREFRELSPRRKVHVLRFISMFDELESWDTKKGYRPEGASGVLEDVLPVFFGGNGWGVGHYGQMMIGEEDLGGFFHHMMKNPSRLRIFCQSIVYNPHLPPMFVPEILVMSRLRYFHEGPLRHLRHAVEMMMRGRTERMVGPEMVDFVNGVLKGYRLNLLHSMLRDEEAAELLRGCETDDELHGMMLSGSIEFLEYRSHTYHKMIISTVSSEMRILTDGGEVTHRDLQPRRRGRMPSDEISRMTSVSDWSDTITLERLARMIGEDVILDMSRILAPISISRMRGGKDPGFESMGPFDVVEMFEVCSRAGSLACAYLAPGSNPLMRNLVSLTVGKMMTRDGFSEWLGPLKRVDVIRAFDMVMDAYLPSDILIVEEILGSEIGSRRRISMADVTRAFELEFDCLEPLRCVYHGTSLERFINGHSGNGVRSIREVGLLSPSEMGNEDYEAREHDLDKVFYSMDPAVAAGYAYRTASQDAARGISTSPIIISIRFEGGIAALLPAGLAGGICFSRWMCKAPAPDFTFDDISHVICSLLPMRANVPCENSEHETIPPDRIERISHLPMDVDDGAMVVNRFFPKKPVIKYRGQQFFSRRMGRVIVEDPTKIEMIRGVAFDDDEIETCRPLLEGGGFLEWS